jgi:glycerol kinase
VKNLILSIDQSTSGTKAFLFGPDGVPLGRSDCSHRQIISPEGWVSHDPMEIYSNTVKVVKAVIAKCGADKNAVAAIGISNQRETAVLWNRHTGRPVCEAIVWQCTRAADLCRGLLEQGVDRTVRRASGLPLSPYFAGAKMAWALQNIPEAREAARENGLCCGTVDSWLIWKLTGGASFRTDYSNASRTGLMSLKKLCWDEHCCDIFSLSPDWLPELTDSDGCFGETTLEGYFDAPIPIRAAMGDSHSALFGHRCWQPGMAKATYGTGSSVMMNAGDTPAEAPAGLVSSVGWRRNGQTCYVLEGNINYTGSVVKWLVEDVKLLSASREAGEWAKKADPRDSTYLVPAFTGLGAPYWDDSARAILCGISRRTGKAEIVKAAEESIAYQICDIAAGLQRALGKKLSRLCADGGAVRDEYLMQLQSDLLNIPVLVPENQELSGAGAALMAGMAVGLYTGGEFDGASERLFYPAMDPALRERKCSGWKDAVHMAMQHR